MPTQTDPFQITRNPSTSAFEAIVNGQRAFLAYDESGTQITLNHTEVPKPLEGHGIAAALVRYALEYAKRHHLSVIARCPYVIAYLRKHPEYHSLVAQA